MIFKPKWNTTSCQCVHNIIVVDLLTVEWMFVFILYSFIIFGVSVSVFMWLFCIFYKGFRVFPFPLSTFTKCGCVFVYIICFWQSILFVKTCRSNEPNNTSNAIQWGWQIHKQLITFGKSKLKSWQMCESNYKKCAHVKEI